MEKNGNKNSAKVVSIICIVAILAAFICQFIPCWSYTGIVQDTETKELRAASLNASVASYVWFPYTSEGAAFEAYLKDPSVYYDQTLEVKKYTQEEFDAIESAIASMNEVPEEEAVEVAEDEEATEAEEIVVDVENEVPSVITSTLVNIYEHQKDADKVTENEKKVMDAYSMIDAKNMSTEVCMTPVIGFLLILVALILALIGMITQKKALLPALAAIFVGVHQIIIVLTQPLFLICEKRTLFLIVYGVVALIGLLVLLFKEVKGAVKAKKA